MKRQISGLPDVITSHDLLKLTAVLLMIVDHIGYYFDDDNLWWRAVGRLSAPIWLFLVGYARSRDLGRPIWVMCFVLILADIAVGIAVFPLNILSTILLCRMTLDPALRWLGGDNITESDRLYPFVFVLFILALPTMVFFEYGTVAFLFVMLGHMVRDNSEKGGSSPLKNEPLFTFAIVSSLIYSFYQVLLFGFNSPQQSIVFFGSLIVMSALLWFRSGTWESFSQALPLGCVKAVMAVGRHTLAIYGIHLIVFQLADFFLGDPDLTPFSFRLVDW